MDASARVAFACYLTGAAISVVFGAIYLARREFMPYHRAAAGSGWQELAPGVRVLLLAMLRGVGGLFLANGIAVLALLAIPFRRGEPWAAVALPVVGLAAALPTLWGIHLVRSRTPGRPPWGLALLHAALFAAGAVASSL